MSTPLLVGETPDVPLRGELRYGLELARLLGDRNFRAPRRRTNGPPVLLLPGFMAGDQSLAVLAGWLRRRGSRTSSAGIRFNVGCAERAMTGIERRLRRLAERSERPVVVIGQSRGGELGRVAAVRHPDLVGALVTLGSPVLAPLSVGPGVLNAVRSVARLGDLGVPGLFSSECGTASAAPPSVRIWWRSLCRRSGQPRSIRAATGSCPGGPASTRAPPTSKWIRATVACR